MLTVELRFPGGRYHATPWNRQVNEGAVEWPPSPWRLVRALLATWHLKVGPGELDQGLIEALVVRLGCSLPEYLVPAAVAAHTRHYMPQFEVPKGKTSKVFDPFLRLAGEPLLIRWPDVDLTAREREALSLLLDRLGYLGRAESWVEARLSDVAGFDANAYPEAPSSMSVEETGMETTELLALMPPDRFPLWREATEGTMEAVRLAEKRARAVAKGRDPEGQRLTAADRRWVREGLPQSLLEVAQGDTSTLQRYGWSRPPGTRWVRYRRPAIPTSVPRRARTSGHGRPPEVARFTVASQVPPRLTEALSVGERIHDALVELSDGHPVFTGRSEDGDRAGNHRHAYILLEAHAPQGRISHVTLFAEDRFDVRARAALRTLSERGVWGRGGQDLQLVLVGFGERAELAGWDVTAGACDLLVEASAWRSRTPFVPTRYPKTRKNGTPKTCAHDISVGDASFELLHRAGIFKSRNVGVRLQVAGPAQDLLRLLELRDFPPPTSITPVADAHLGGRPTRWIEFRTRRKRGAGRRGLGSGLGFVVEFPERVSGPLVLGYGAHFGLGTFGPLRPASAQGQ